MAAIETKTREFKAEDAHIKFISTKENKNDEILTLETICFGDTRNRNFNEYAQFEYRHPTSKEMIGYIETKVIDLKNEIGVYISSLCVHPTYRRSGIASRLISFIEKFYKDVTRTFSLHVKAINIEAQGLYNKMGFIQIEFIEDYYSPGEDGLLMIKEKV